MIHLATITLPDAAARVWRVLAIVHLAAANSNLTVWRPH